jgi:hypothetical protein
VLGRGEGTARPSKRRGRDGEVRRGAGTAGRLPAGAGRGLRARWRGECGRGGDCGAAVLGGGDCGAAACGRDGRTQSVYSFGSYICNVMGNG